MQYTDAHCHIVPTTISDPDVIGRICSATCESDWKTFTENTDDETFICIGLHPWYIQTAQNGWLNRMTNILRTSPNVMVGEIGLDKNTPDMPRQIQIFTGQLEMAAALRRPVHLHCVGAWDKILHILKEHKNALPPAILAHRFSGDPDLIEKLTNDYNMSFSYHAAPQVGEKFSARVLATPSDKLLIESDASDTATQIQILQETVQTLSDILGAAPDDICAQNYTNFQRITSYVRPID